MSDHPLHDLIDDIKARPVPYATVAAVGVAAAMMLAARAARDDRSGVRKTVDHVANAVGDEFESARQRVGPPPASSGIGGGTIAVVLGTLITTGVTGWRKLRDEQQERMATGSQADTDDPDATDTMNDKTVAELRTIATERDISGRSSMNKNALVDALVDARADE